MRIYIKKINPRILLAGYLLLWLLALILFFVAAVEGLELMEKRGKASSQVQRKVVLDYNRSKEYDS